MGKFAFILITLTVDPSGKVETASQILDQQLTSQDCLKLVDSMPKREKTLPNGQHLVFKTTCQRT